MDGCDVMNFRLRAGPKFVVLLNSSLHIPYSIMSVLTSVSGFAAFGVLVRTYALGLQRRPLLSSMLNNNKKENTTTPSLDAIY